MRTVKVFISLIPLILYFNCIVSRCLINVAYLAIFRLPLSGHDDVAFLNDVANDAE